jgi:FkbH-like protein
MKPRVLKGVVWDLDDTLWTGVLGEGDAVALRPEAAALVRTLDQRGVLQSIASRNDEHALTVLDQMGLRDYFLYPQLGAMAKSAALTRIAAALDLASDALAFIDDDPRERAEVSLALPEVLCLDAREVASLLTRPDVVVPAGTGLNRRQLHLADRARRQALPPAEPPSEAFLRSLEMRLTLRRADLSDLPRIDELMLRTNQLNSTGRHLPADDLARLCAAQNYLVHLALVADLRDRFGDQGTIAFALLERAGRWTLRMLLVSCRVRDQGVGSAILDAILTGAERARAPLHADFVPTGRNRHMQVTLMLAGFEAGDGDLVWRPPAGPRPPASPWITVDDASGVLRP